jgi:hypothetical protein
VLAGNDFTCGDFPEYSQMMKVISKFLFPGFSTEAVQRRMRIEKVLPNMSPETELDTKPRGKKGGK